MVIKGENNSYIDSVVSQNSGCQVVYLYNIKHLKVIKNISDNIMVIGVFCKVIRELEESLVR